MEFHNILGCYISIHHPSSGSIEGYNQFFYENNFLVISQLKPEQDISQILSSVYSFDMKNSNIKIIRGEKKIYLPNKTYITIDKDSIFGFDRKKLKVFY
jgi:hypothetical protein